APPAPVALPKIERYTMPNGLRVIVVANHELPIVTMHLAVGAGLQDEPEKKRTIADFAAALLTKGTAKHKADEIASTMDFVGGTLAADANLESTHVVCRVVTRDLGTCLSLMPEVVMQPIFPAQEKVLVRDQLIAGLKQQREDQAQLAGLHLLN